MTDETEQLFEKLIQKIEGSADWKPVEGPVNEYDTAYRRLRAAMPEKPAWPESFFKTVDNGHRLWFDGFDPYDLTVFCNGEPGWMNALAEAWETGVPMKKRMTFLLDSYKSECCDYCRSNIFTTDGFTIYGDDKYGGCRYPDGFPVVAVDIPIPSGRMLFGNDFREWLPADDRDFNVNSSPGIRDTVLAQAKIGVGHFFVGNTCPSFYRQEDGSFLIANAPYLTDDEDQDEDAGMTGENIGGVITDLWWVSIVDAAKAARNKLGKRRAAEIWATEVEVPPGTYRLEYYGLARSFDRDAVGVPIIYAKFFLPAESTGVETMCANQTTKGSE